MVLITGANGLVGSFLIKRLIALGYEVRGLVRKNSDRRLLETVPNEFLFEADLLNTFELEQAFDGIKTVIHTAAIVSFDPSMSRKMRMVNVEGTKNLVNLSILHNISYFIHISSVSALGKKSMNEKINESINWDSEESSNYGETKFESELEVWRGQTEGLPVLILSPSTTLGPGDWERSSTQLFKYVWEKNKYYSSGILNYVDLRDLIDIITYFIKEKIVGEKYIISAGSIPYFEFFKKVALNFSIKHPNKLITPFKASIAIFSAKILSFFTGKMPFITREVVQNSNAKVVYDNSKIIELMNFEFRSLENTIEWTCNNLLKKK